MDFSDSELLALAAIHRRAPRCQQSRQAELIAEFVHVESQPSCALLKRRRWSRAENSRHQGIVRRLAKGAA